jgi:glycine hydroxymethyltransferase
VVTSLLDHYLAQAGNERRSDVIAYLAALDHLHECAPSIAENILKELHTQRSTLKLIASENYSSLSVQLAMGNLLTDKYCEGSPYHRFYAGCENVDAIEAEAVDLAKQLFGTAHAYVQPHSGADANLVAFWAILTQSVQNPLVEKLGKKNLEELSDQEFESLRQLLCNQSFMGMSLGAGGHLTHGFRQNVSAKMMRAIPYGVDPTTHLLDYGKIAEIARREAPYPISWVLCTPPADQFR